jgi:ABC-type glycerol-3-phosphate transport system permease component
MAIATCAAMPARPWRRSLLRGLRRATVVVVLLYTITPILWVVAISLRDPVRTMTIPPELLVRPTFHNYRDLFAGIWGNFAAYYVNTVIVCGLAVLLSLAVGMPAAFGLSRAMVRQRWANVFLGTMTVIYAIPPISLTIPFYDIFSSLGLFDTRTALVLAYQSRVLPFAVWMMKTFFDEIPRELDDAGMVDGLSRVQVARHVVLPLSLPGIFATAVFCLILVWNDLPLALVLTSTPQAQTLTVGILAFVQENVTLWNPMSAAAVVALVPVIFFVLLIQRRLVQGFGSGLKG